jgi:hypothetical protein
MVYENRRIFEEGVGFLGLDPPPQEKKIPKP